MTKRKNETYDDYIGRLEGELAKARRARAGVDVGSILLYCDDDTDTIQKQLVLEVFENKRTGSIMAYSVCLDNSEITASSELCVLELDEPLIFEVIGKVDLSIMNKSFDATIEKIRKRVMEADL